MTIDDLHNFKGTMFTVPTPDFLLGDESHDAQAAFIAEKQRMIYRNTAPPCRILIVLQYAARVYEVDVSEGWRWAVITPEGQRVVAPDGSATKPLTEGVTRGLVRSSCGIISLEDQMAQALRRIEALEKENAAIRGEFENLKIERSLLEVERAVERTKEMA